VGMSRDEAVATLTQANLRASVYEVYSEKEPGEVTGQNPGAGIRVPEGDTVRINVSRGIKLVNLPSVVGQTLNEAQSTLEDAGFTVAPPVFQESDKPENEVLSQDPEGGSQQRPGTTVTLTVSKGPAKVAVPDVEGDDVVTARATLRNAGFKVAVEKADTDDPLEEGVVLGQSPAANVEAEKGSTVTLTVGRYVPPPTTTETTSTTTETTTTETIPFP
jgi:eukaryotic-like serine/threonine-protein kinase